MGTWHLVPPQNCSLAVHQDKYASYLVFALGHNNSYQEPDSRNRVPTSIEIRTGFPDKIEAKVLSRPSHLPSLSITHTWKLKQTRMTRCEAVRVLGNPCHERKKALQKQWNSGCVTTKRQIFKPKQGYRLVLRVKTRERVKLCS